MSCFCLWVKGKSICNFFFFLVIFWFNSKQQPRNLVFILDIAILAKLQILLCTKILRKQNVCSEPERMEGMLSVLPAEMNWTWRWSCIWWSLLHKIAPLEFKGFSGGMCTALKHLTSKAVEADRKVTALRVECTVGGDSVWPCEKLLSQNKPLLTKPIFLSFICWSCAFNNIASFCNSCTCTHLQEVEVFLIFCPLHYA